MTTIGTHPIRCIGMSNFVITFWMEYWHFYKQFFFLISHCSVSIVMTWLREHRTQWRKLHILLVASIYLYGYIIIYFNFNWHQRVMCTIHNIGYNLYLHKRTVLKLIKDYIIMLHLLIYIIIHYYMLYIDNNIVLWRSWRRPIVIRIAKGIIEVKQNATKYWENEQ